MFGQGRGLQPAMAQKTTRTSLYLGVLALAASFGLAYSLYSSQTWLVRMLCTIL